MMRFLFVSDDDFNIPEVDARVFVDGSPSALVVAHEALSVLQDWTAESVEAALRGALINGLGLKPRQVFGSVRVAVTGRRVSPPLFESMRLLRRERSLARIASARDRALPVRNSWPLVGAFCAGAIFKREPLVGVECLRSPRSFKVAAVKNCCAPGVRVVCRAPSGRIERGSSVALTRAIVGMPCLTFQ
jgi:hypothetical protein